MEWVIKNNETLKPLVSRDSPVCLDLFAGCGGLGLGFEAAGFYTFGYEIDRSASETYQSNLHGICNNDLVSVGLPVPEADIVIGGPPCQPFSVGGKQLGPRDSRDGFPSFLDIVERVNPAIVLIENVRGMAYRNKGYLGQVLMELENLGYLTSSKLLNAVKFDVPQNRERTIIIGTKVGWTWPSLTSNSTVTAMQAIGDTAHLHSGESKWLTSSMDAYIAKYEKASKCINPRDLDLSRPSRTVTCRNLGGATGDMMRVRLPDGRRRRLTHREAARIQSFPDWFRFRGSEYKVFEQIGNAVPPRLALALGKSCMSHLMAPTSAILDEYEAQTSLQI
jgi:DNA (cytosine-5)-methyltransferase 1